MQNKNVITRRNNQTNQLIRRIVIVCDFLLLNALLVLFRWLHPAMSQWTINIAEVFWVVCNMAMLLAQWKFGTIIHQHIVSGGDILRRVFQLGVLQTVSAYLVMKAVEVGIPVGWLLLQIGVCQIVCLVIARLLERQAVKLFRRLGMNTRTITFVGADPELLTLYQKLVKNPTLGYRVMGYYADESLSDSQNPNEELVRLGSMGELMEAVKAGRELHLGEEMYVCLPRRERETLHILSDYCDRHVIHFYYVPASEERLDFKLIREFYDDTEIFTTREVPLENGVNRMVKRLFDIVVSAIVLVCCLPLLPIVALIIKRQSPGSIFFRQQRTGINGREFVCYKLRSMHANTDADKRQATKDDPRTFPFGSFMRKYDIDEFPQFWNVLKGDMSIVGPRPHMLLHTEMYSHLIGDYMVRHFVKPGITGWAQTTGFRGETKELWQMEERVRRDVWYIENWSVWLDLRIIWMTVRTIFVHDEHAY